MKDPRIGTSAVNHPSHYNQGKIEVIEFIEDQNMGFHLGNALKYISRAGKKNPEKLQEDLDKAKWYITRFLEIQKENPRRPNDMSPQTELPIEDHNYEDRTLSNLVKYIINNEHYRVILMGIVAQSINSGRQQEFEDTINEAIANNMKVDATETKFLDIKNIE